MGDFTAEPQSRKERRGGAEEDVIDLNLETTDEQDLRRYKIDHKSYFLPVPPFLVAAARLECCGIGRLSLFHYSPLNLSNGSQEIRTLLPPLAILRRTPRGGMDVCQYKDYVLVLLFVK